MRLRLDMLHQVVWTAQRIIFLCVIFGSPVAAASPRPDGEPKGKALVIVAPRSFHKVLRPFVAHKQKLLPTELVALEDVLKKHEGGDDPEKLKRFLYDRWKTAHLGYALLVGNASVMPVRYMVLDRVTPAAFDIAFYPSDLYYADLAKTNGAFDDWNGNKESFHAHYFGEVHGEKNKNDPINYDKISYVPEIAVGRWPVGVPAQALLISEKTMAYENSLLSGAKPGANTAALMAVEGWVDGRGLLDGVARDLGKRYRIEKRYYGGGAPPNQQELLGILNAGAGLVFHIGHGSNEAWANCCDYHGVLQAANADRLPVMISAGCSTAYCAPLPPYEGYVDRSGKSHRGTNQGEVFKSPPPAPANYQHRAAGPLSLGEAVLVAAPNGAVAYIGCNTGGQPCALTLLAGFAQALGKQKEPRLGDAWMAAVRYYYTRENLAKLKPNADWYPPSIFFQGMKYMVFGDPSLRMPAGK
jgi:hypothetical protein